MIIPIPFSFLGYHPGTLRSTERLNFRVTRTSYTDPLIPRVYTPVYDLTLADGSVLIDIDDWLVYLLWKVLDKLEVRHIVFFSYQGAWIGLVEGKGKVFRRDMREYFDFTNNKIIYPIPDKLDAMGQGFIKASPSLATLKSLLPPGYRSRGEGLMGISRESGSGKSPVIACAQLVCASGDIHETYPSWTKWPRRRRAAWRTGCSFFPSFASADTVPVMMRRGLPSPRMGPKCGALAPWRRRPELALCFGFPERAPEGCPTAWRLWTGTAASPSSTERFTCG